MVTTVALVPWDSFRHVENLAKCHKKSMKLVNQAARLSRFGCKVSIIAGFIIPERSDTIDLRYVMMGESNGHSIYSSQNMTAIVNVLLIHLVDKRCTMILKSRELRPHKNEDSHKSLAGSVHIFH